jgi:branched-chain amino acid transport system substrate-binding protein
VLEDLSVKEGFQLKTFAVPPPGVEMVRAGPRHRPALPRRFRDRALFGPSPSVSIKELKRVGYPLRKVVSFVWGSAEATSRRPGAGPSPRATTPCSSRAWAGLPRAQRDPRHVQEAGQGAARPRWRPPFYYNRGVLIGALHAEAIRTRSRPSGRQDHRQDVKAGFEKISTSRWRAGAAAQDHPDDTRAAGWCRSAGEGRQVRRRRTGITRTDVVPSTSRPRAE